MKTKRTSRWVERQIGDFFRVNRRMPTYSEMMDLLSVRSKSVVDFWIKKLITEGVLEKDARGFLRIARQALGIPMVGEIRAGFPSPAEEELQDIISLDEFLINRPDSSFLLQVAGDSMIDEGIREGDLVIIEKGREPKNGDIVVAEVDGDWTLKYFRREGREVVLEAANPNYPLIRAREELRIGGVVSAVVRKYHK